VNTKGALLVDTEPGKIVFSPPVAYQQRDDEKKPVSVKYLVEKDSYGFQLGPYDPDRPLVIDPLIAATFLGGKNSSHNIRALAVDGSNNVYVTGDTNSTTFPTTPGAYQTSLVGDPDLFISKFNGNLSQLLASTYLGGSWSEHVWCLAVDGMSNVYIGGYTVSADFPVKSGLFGGRSDAIVVKMDGDLTNLLASFVFGGALDDDVRGIVLDGSDSVYVTGTTFSRAEDFLTPGAYMSPVTGGNSDVYVARLGSGVSGMLTCAILGGGLEEKASAIALDPSGSHVYVLGSSDSQDFPCKKGEIVAGSDDIFVAKLNTALSTLEASYGTGGPSKEEPTSMTVDRDGNIYIAGNSFSDSFRWAGGDGFWPEDGRSTRSGQSGFISKFDSDSTNMVRYLFLHADDWVWIKSIAVDRDFYVYVTGYTDSSQFPVTAGAYDETYNGGKDCFITKCDFYLTKVVASTYLGGGFDDESAALALDGYGNLYVAGHTDSTDFPVTVNAFDQILDSDPPGFWDHGFVAWFSPDLSHSAIVPSDEPRIEVEPVPIEFGKVTLGESAEKTATVRNTGILPLEITSVTLGGHDSDEFSISHSCTRLEQNQTCPIRVTFSPVLDSLRNAQLIIESNDPDRGTVIVEISGTGVSKKTSWPDTGGGGCFLTTTGSGIPR